MSGKTLRAILRDLGLLEQEWAVLCAVHPNTVSGWIGGRVSVPGSVRSYARLLLADHRRKAKDAARNRRRRQSARLMDNTMRTSDRHAHTLAQARRKPGFDPLNVEFGKTGE